MKIISWNINGLRAACEKGFLAWLADEKPDLVCLQEVKAQEDQLSEEILNPEGYRLHVCSAERKGYSGTGVYVREDCKVLKEASFSCGLLNDEYNSEGRVLRIDCPDFILFNVYFPNGSRDQERRDYKNAFNEVLLEELRALIAEGKRVIVCGDVNIAHAPIDLKNPKSNENHSGFLPEERRYLDRLLESGFKDSFRFLYPEKIQYSWWSMRFSARATNAGWRIDYFFVSDNLIPYLQEATVDDHIEKISDKRAVSDHCPISITLDL